MYANSFAKTKINVGEVFGFNTAKPIECGKFENSRPYIPGVISNFYFDPELTKCICNFLDTPRGDALYIFGATGCGKSETVRQICAKLNYPVIEVTGSGSTEMSELLGHLSMENGSMVYKDGALLHALKHGEVFVLNEMDLIKSSELMLINDLLSSGQITVIEDGAEQIIKAHPDFRFIATGNSCGCGDDNGAYVGVRVQNLAFMDRFRLVGAAYMPLDKEIDLIAKEYPELPANIIRVLCRSARAIRRISEGFAGDTLSITVSTRSLKRWAGLCLDFVRMGDNEPIKNAMRQSFGFRATNSERIAIERIVEEETARVRAGVPDDQAEFDAYYDAKEEAAINGAE